MRLRIGRKTKLRVSDFVDRLAKTRQLQLGSSDGRCMPIAGKFLVGLNDNGLLRIWLGLDRARQLCDLPEWKVTIFSASDRKYRVIDP